MKALSVVLVVIVGFSSACVSRPVVVLKETELRGQNDVEFWAEYGKRVMEFDAARVQAEMKNLKRYQDDKSWRIDLKMALLLGLMPRTSKDLQEAQKILISLQGREDLAEETALVLEWYLLSFKKSQLLFEVANKSRQESIELQEKLRALSTIEKQIQERSDQIAR